LGINYIQMNRLVIVGNGFDIAHGLPTRYCDFINSYWSDIFTKIKDDKVFDIEYEDNFIELNINLRYISDIKLLADFREVNSYLDFKQFLKKCSEEGRRLNPFSSLKFHNSFFQIINHHHSIQNWVDIENEYYKLLKKCLDEKENIKVRILNEEFEQVKNLLEIYLSENVYKQINFLKPNGEIDKMKKIFDIWNRFTDKDNFYEEFSKEDKKEVEYYSNKLRKYNISGKSDLSEFIISENIEIENLFLNFNYTPTIDAYIQSLENTDMKYYGNSTNLQIHGKLDDKINKINFGFGDEMDKRYQEIEEKDDNEYLKNIKSFQYLQTSNYKQLLDFVESKKFQIYIMGHSCGISDRILLNTLFENPNCRSIKVFFYENEKGNNYTEIVQNISRHFNKKKMMRDKIVNKSLCQPLPQNIRFAKKESGSQS
jgi:hypothetical protein